YRRARVIAAGGFRPDYAMAQDWDMVFRVTAQTDRVHHIPRILYHWQITPGSAGHRADAQHWRARCHADHVRERLGADAVSFDSPLIGYFQVRVPIVGEPLV